MHPEEIFNPDPQHPQNCFKTVIRKAGQRKLFEITFQQLGLRQPDTRPSLIWSQPRPNMKNQRRWNAHWGGGPKQGLQKNVSITWFRTVGREATLSLPSQMARTRAQHEGSKLMQCTSEKFSIQTPNID